MSVTGEVMLVLL